MNRLATKLFGTVLIALSLIEPAIASAQETSGAGSPENSIQQTSQPESAKPANDLPDSPGATQTTNQDSTSTPRPPDSSPVGTETQPTGTAAAPAVRVSGNPVSRPAGAAIAPPKQRQVRSFLIKLGFIAGAGVALGTVAAFSLSSPARVPGSH
jgi:cytoskeletal protein RodZ